MANENIVHVVGNLTRDPEMRYTPSGTTNTTFGIAVNRRWQNRQSGEWEEATSFFNVVCWRDLAEHVAESLSKGSRAIVVGRLEQRSWDDEKTGDRRSVVEIVADEVGPSLRWASAEVTKAERRAPEAVGAGRSAPNAPTDEGGNYDEEPF